MMQYAFVLVLALAISSTGAQSCAGIPCTHGQNFAFPRDCTKFCQCVWGNGVEKTCNVGLHFSPTLGTCVAARNAGCQAGCQKVKTCPAQNTEFAIHLKNPDDCGSFCKCDWGVPIWFKCPGGLEFNEDIQVCDWPATAGCSIPRPPPSTTTPKTTTTTTTARPSLCASIKCTHGDYFPYPGDCTRFCQCVWGVGAEHSCPSGLDFNTDLNVCDWPANAGCRGGRITTTTAAPKPPTPPPTTGCETVKCPAENPKYALHLPNPRDCVSFCKCDWGKAYYFACPSGLHFNADLQVCDWPQYAGCRR